MYQNSDILLRKSVIFAGLLNFNFWVPGQPTNIRIGAWANLSKYVDKGFDIMLVSILSTWSIVTVALPNLVSPADGLMYEDLISH